MTRDEAIDLLQVMLLDESEAAALRPAAFVGRLRPAMLDPKTTMALRAARRRKQPILIEPASSITAQASRG